MFEVLSEIRLPSMNPEVALNRLMAAFPCLSEPYNTAALTALHRMFLNSNQAFREVTCGRWSCDSMDRTFSGGSRVEQALTELEGLGYVPAPITATIVAELEGRVPRDAGRASHISLQRILADLPDPSKMDPDRAALQRFLNSTTARKHYVCLYFETFLGARKAGFFGRETMLEFVPGSIVLVTPNGSRN